MEWQLKIKLVAMISEAESKEDRDKLRNFITKNIFEFDQQAFGIVVRSFKLSTNFLQEDLKFYKLLKQHIKKIDLNKFSGVEKKKIHIFFQELQSLKYVY